MLCGTCEDLFGKNETYFANTIFHPYLKKEKIKFDYDERLFYFLTSVSWRSLYLDLIDFVENHVVGINALECLISSETIMREYLIYKRVDISKIENHIFFFDDIKEICGDLDFSRLHPHATIHRGITSYTFCNEQIGTYGTITNMLGVIIFTLYQLGKEEKWENTRIVNGFGNIESQNQKIASVACSELTNIMQIAHAANNTINETQQKKIKQRIENEGESIKNSAIYKDWMNDEYISYK